MRLSAGQLGARSFCTAFHTRYAYACGAMYKAIASVALVERAARAGILAFYGSGGVPLDSVESALRKLSAALPPGAPWGANLLCDLNDPESEERAVELYAKQGVRIVEAAAFLGMTRALVQYRASGVRLAPDGSLCPEHRIVAKVSRPEVAQAFLEPPPERLLRQLTERGRITPDQASLAARLPMCDAITVEADSGGHTDRGVAYTLLPSIRRLRDRVVAAQEHHVFVGAAGGIGTPEAAAAALMLGADYLLTGSINQCTVEAGQSETVKDLLAGVRIQDTAYAPAGDMFELGAKVQVVRKGVFFPARSNKLFELYQRHDSLEQIDQKTREQLEKSYFRKSLNQVWAETQTFFEARDPAQVQKANRDPKHKMALVFRWYFGFATRAALEGNPDYKSDYQIQCGPALGAFNAWVEGTELASWRNRHVDDIGLRLLQGTADCLESRFLALARSPAGDGVPGDGVLSAGTPG